MNILDDKKVREFFGYAKCYWNGETCVHNVCRSEMILRAMQEPVRVGDRYLGISNYSGDPSIIEHTHTVVDSLNFCEEFHPFALRLPDRFQKPCECGRPGFHGQEKPAPEPENCSPLHGACRICFKCKVCAQCKCTSSAVSDTEINQAVAVKLGWTHGKGKTFNNVWISPDGNIEVETLGAFPICDFCHSIEAAWEIVEDQREKGYFRMYQDREFMGHGQRLGYVCVLGIPNSTKFIEEWAATAPMAICKAFLKLELK